MYRMRFVLFAAAFLLVACDAEPSGDAPSGDESAAAAQVTRASDHNVELPDGLDSAIPIPESARMVNHVARSGGHTITFQPGISYADTVEFYASNLSGHGWSITEEEVKAREDLESGEDGSQWKATGHGVNLRVAVVPLGAGQVLIEIQ